MEKDNNPKYDVVIALGKNWGPDKKRLSLESRMTALAAGKLLKDGVTKRVIFTGGYTAGSEMPSEAEAMLNHMTRNYGDQVGVYLEDKSIDTSRNAENVRGMINEGDKVMLLSVGYHFPRAKRIFGSYGVEADAMSSEKVLADNNHIGKFLKNYRESPRHNFEAAKEIFILNPISWFDRKGIALRGIASLLRKGK